MEKVKKYNKKIVIIICGENLKYEKEELNLINHINVRINNLEGRMSIMDLKIKFNSQILKDIFGEWMNNYQKISSIENKIIILKIISLINYYIN